MKLFLTLLIIVFHLFIFTKIYLKIKKSKFQLKSLTLPFTKSEKYVSFLREGKKQNGILEEEEKINS